MFSVIGMHLKHSTLKSSDGSHKKAFKKQLRIFSILFLLLKAIKDWERILCFLYGVIKSSYAGHLISFVFAAFYFPSF